MNRGPWAPVVVFGARSPAGFDLLSVAIIEIVVTAVFVLIVLGTTDEDGVPKGFGRPAIRHATSVGSVAAARSLD